MARGDYIDGGHRHVVSGKEERGIFSNPIAVLGSLSDCRWHRYRADDLHANHQRDASEQEIDQELARRVGISRQAVIAIESGKYSPSLELAFRLALVFDKPIGEVFTCKSSGRETAEAESGTENK